MNDTVNKKYNVFAPSKNPKLRQVSPYKNEKNHMSISNIQIRFTVLVDPICFIADSTSS